MSHPHPYANVYHRDGTVTYWDVYSQSWARVRADRISDRTLSTMSDEERARIHRIRIRLAL
jgi:hypothetical protein